MADVEKLGASHVVDQLQRGRRELLDLSTRNRLLSVPVGSKTARIVNVYDEKSSEVYRLLVDEGKALAFVPGKVGAEPTGSPASVGINGSAGTELVDEDETNVSLPQPNDEGEQFAGGIAARHTDHKLQTKLTPEALQRRLLDMQYDAATFFEEQGVNILFLALGQLKWFDAATSDIERYAPLVLIPVRLERKSVSQRFRIVWTEDDAAENISLSEKMKSEFGLTLPEFKQGDDFSIGEYFSEIGAAVSGQPKWEVRPDAMVLGFFSFAKFLMWRDLEPTRWPEGVRIDAHQLIQGLLGDGFPENRSLIAEDSDIDDLVKVPELKHVVDADSSQALAIECVRSGANLVIQGPPGTGKSQTITNLIAAAVADGKKVLFVAEKMAALEVVKRRLDNVGLGPLCLELHSNRSTKKHVLDSLRDGWDLGAPVIESAGKIHDELTRLRDKLNGHARLMHKPLEPAGYSPYGVIGQLVALSHVEMPHGTVLETPEKWTRTEMERREALVVDLASRIGAIGKPEEHAFRGVRRAGLLRPELDRLLKNAAKTKDEVVAVMSTGTALAQELCLPCAIDSRELAQQVAMARHFAKGPVIDRSAIANSIWAAGFSRLAKLVATGKRYTALSTTLASQKLAPVAWGIDVQSARTAISAHGGSLFRIFNGDYRRGMATLRSLLAGPVPKVLDGRIQLLDQLLEGQKCLNGIRDGLAAGSAAFGRQWTAETSDWDQLELTLEWVDGMRKAGLADSCLTIFAQIESPSKALRVAEQADGQLARVRSDVNELFAVAELDLERAFGVGSAETIPLDTLLSRLEQWCQGPETIFAWMAYFAKESEAIGAGLKPLVLGLSTGTLAAKSAQSIFKRGYFERLLEVMAGMEPRLAQFDGVEQNNAVQQFRVSDKRRIDLARAETALAHFEGLPKGGTGVGPVGVLKGELARKRGHMPIRKLFRMTAPVVQAIKPVFMMSPLSVAQFLEPGAIAFDLLVIDEASQVEPVDSLGAIARCVQIVVVGDDKQLPPTRFFMRVTSDAVVEDEDDDGAAKVGDVESVLTLCLAKGVPDRMLRWHYRSRHHSLIAVSNSEFYGNKLFVVPSPYTAAAGNGLIFHHVADGVFESGGTAVNRVEAQEVARAIIKHASETPQLSLGVATFSIKQRQAIRDELEVLLRQSPQLEPFFNDHSNEPFFIKNLENVQGDERDVIFISVAYGRNAQGYMAMRFGPLSAEGGERRLNVLISRAKRRCEVFSSITADDIDLERARGRGVAGLKIFLSFAQNGRLAIAKRTDRDVESPFEESVKRALESEGHEVHAQIGIAGFFIDLAVADREKPGRYVLGIECDGAAYHSSRSARDRDRLRQAVLEDQGWIIHRIWSADWFAKPKDELKKVLEAVQRAKDAVEEADSALEKAQTKQASLRVDFIARHDHDSAIVSVGRRELPYEECKFLPPHGREPHELSEREMSEIVARVVDSEGPIHDSEIIARVRTNWGLQRAGSRIQQAVISGIARAVADRRVVRDGTFYDIEGRGVRVRSRAVVESSGLRKPECLAPAEIRKAVVNCVQAGMGAKREEIVSDVADAIGFKQVSAQLRTRIDGVVQDLLDAKALVMDGAIVRLPRAPTAAGTAVA